MEKKQIKSHRAQLVIFKEQGDHLAQDISEASPCIIDTPNGKQMRAYCVLPESTSCKCVPVNFAVAINHDYGDNSIPADIIKLHRD